MELITKSRLEGLACGLAVGVVSFWGALPHLSKPQSDYVLKMDGREFKVPAVWVLGRPLPAVMTFNSPAPEENWSVRRRSD